MYLNEFSHFDIVTAAKTNGFNIMSAGLSPYVSRSYPGSDPNFREYPVGSATTDLSDTRRIPSSQSMDLINKQINQKGFSVVMMHFIEFTDGNGNLNQASLDDLVNLINMVINAGYKLTTLQGLTTNLYGSSGSSSSSSSSSTTGRLTTGKSSTSTSTSTGRSSTSTSTSSSSSSSSSGDFGACSNTGSMRCVPSNSNKYQTCDHGFWQPYQSCQAGLVCRSNGPYIICDRP